MDSQNPYGFGEAVGNPLMPVSAFSAYNLLKNCNYFLASQDPDIKQQIRNANIHSELPLNAEPDKAFLSFPAKSFLSSPTLFTYPHQIHLITESPLRVDPSALSPCSSSCHASSNLKRQRGEKKPIPEEQKDDRYFERRRRNNQAAKKSRDARKMREDQIAMKATILEHENAILRAQLLTIREEASSLRQMLLQKKALELTTREPPLCMN